MTRHGYASGEMKFVQVFKPVRTRTVNGLWAANDAGWGGPGQAGMPQRDMLRRLPDPSTSMDLQPISFPLYQTGSVVVLQDSVDLVAEKIDATDEKERTVCVFEEKASDLLFFEKLESLHDLFGNLIFAELLAALVAVMCRIEASPSDKFDEDASSA
jgi:hypothetical protein